MFGTMKRTGLAMAVALAALCANAQEYPARTVTIVVPFPAGSISDTVARVLADKIRPSLGQSVVIENKPSVGGIVGAQQVARAKPDGYTLMLGSNSTNAINPFLFKQLPYDPTKDFAPITMAGEIPAVIIARPDLPASNLAEVVKLGKSRPLTYAYGNTTNLIAGETLKSVAAIDVTTVPYKGEPLGMNDLLGGQVDLMSLNLPVAFQMIKSGKLKAIALTGPRKVDALPELRLSSESLPRFSMPNGWLAFFAPAGTPRPIVERLHKELAAAMNDPEAKAKIEGTGGYILYSTTPEQLQARINEDARRWSELIKAANIPAQ